MSVSIILFIFVSIIATRADEAAPTRRVVRVALYPFVPDKAGLYWRLEQEFELAYPKIDLRFVDLSGDYYGNQLRAALGIDKDGNHIEPSVDVAEVDTVFLRDFVDEKLIATLPSDSGFVRAEFLPVAAEAAMLDGKLYGIPHWVCGNFMFYRADDPEAEKFEKIVKLDGLERIIGRPMKDADGLLFDLHGRSTLGEEYLDALLDTYGDPQKALAHTNPDMLDATAVTALARVFQLTPGGICDNDKHHEYGQFYPRQFARRNARVFLGYSEQLYYVIDEFLHGIADGNPAVGTIHFDYIDEIQGYDAWSDKDIRVASATLSDTGSHPLAWVDVLAIRPNLDPQTRADALAIIQFLNSEKFTLEILTPQYGEAPRYLLPARASVYTNNKLLRAAPLYPRFFEIMSKSNSITDRRLNERLRSIGKAIQRDGFPSRP